MNKYFAAMREKEMGDSERKAMVRQLEKQGKAVERALEVEKHLSAQVVCHCGQIVAADGNPSCDPGRT